MYKKIVLGVLLIGLLFESKAQETIVKGRVHNWVSDTVYVCELSFHSPHSSVVDYHVISRDSTFEFKWNDREEPFIVCIAPVKKFINNNKQYLLYQNLTDQYYYGQCTKFYKNGATTYLVEPNKTLDLEITANIEVDTLSDERASYYRNLGVDVKENNTVIDYGETRIGFNGTSDNFSNKYYQDLLEERTKLDKILKVYSSKNIPMAIYNLELTKRGLLKELYSNKEKISPVLYDYMLAEIEFGARMEFLKHLCFNNQDYLKEIIASNEIPESILEFIAFDHFKVNSTTVKSEMYNEFIEFYLNLIMNLVGEEYVEYHPFSMEKFKVVVSELPRLSVYYYVANHLLNLDEVSEYDKVFDWIVTQFPNGELNGKLKEKLNS